MIIVLSLIIELKPIIIKRGIELFLKKCRYFKVCKIVVSGTLLCDNGGGSYCGHYRALSNIENGKKEVLK